jgi:hypothetical protein
MTEHEQNLRDLVAMFAMTGLLVRNKKGDDIIASAFELADLFMKARAPQEGGIADILSKWGDQS